MSFTWLNVEITSPHRKLDNMENNDCGDNRDEVNI